MRSTLKAAIIFASAGIAAAQQPQPVAQPVQPPVKERISVPWHQAGPHRASAVRAGEPTPKQTVYTSINGRVISGGESAQEPRMGVKSSATAPEAAKAPTHEVTISRDAGWDPEDDADITHESAIVAPQIAKPEVTPETMAPVHTAAPRLSLVSHDSYVRTKPPSGVSSANVLDSAMPTVTRFETRSLHLRAQPARVADQPDKKAN